STLALAFIFSWSVGSCDCIGSSVDCGCSTFWFCCSVFACCVSSVLSVSFLSASSFLSSFELLFSSFFLSSFDDDFVSFLSSDLLSSLFPHAVKTKKLANNKNKIFFIYFTPNYKFCINSYSCSPFSSYFVTFPFSSTIYEPANSPCLSVKENPHSSSSVFSGSL